MYVVDAAGGPNKPSAGPVCTACDELRGLDYYAPGQCPHVSGLGQVPDAGKTTAVGLLVVVGVGYLLLRRAK